MIDQLSIGKNAFGMVVIVVQTSHGRWVTEGVIRETTYVNAIGMVEIVENPHWDDESFAYECFILDSFILIIFKNQQHIY